MRRATPQFIFETRRPTGIDARGYEGRKPCGTVRQLNNVTKSHESHRLIEETQTYAGVVIEAMRKRGEFRQVSVRGIVGNQQFIGIDDLPPKQNRLARDLAQRSEEMQRVRQMAHDRGCHDDIEFTEDAQGMCLGVVVAMQEFRLCAERIVEDGKGFSVFPSSVHAETPHAAQLRTDREVSIVAGDIKETPAGEAPGNLVKHVVIHGAKSVVGVAYAAPLFRAACLSAENQRGFRSRIAPIEPRVGDPGLYVVRNDEWLIVKERSGPLDLLRTDDMTAQVHTFPRKVNRDIETGACYRMTSES